ncbi:hypothetical protein PT276_08065 [Orbaceae bacterium ESL0721]|nr:hypothetical protein [Orbaceae bacterium ESL0721]
MYTRSRGWVAHYAIRLPDLARKKYRIKPKATPLPIPWEVIPSNWKFAAMDSDGEVFIFTGEPYILERGLQWWCRSAFEVRFADILKIDTTGIDWRKSLTKRPEGV